MSRDNDRFHAARLDDAERALLLEHLAAILRDARRAAALSQEQLAAASGCSRATVDKIEHGLRRPRRGLLVAMSKVLRPDDEARAAELAVQLCDAAGRSLREDAATSARRRDRTRGRRSRAALLAEAERLLAQPAPRRTAPKPNVGGPLTHLPTVPELLEAGRPDLVDQLRAHRARVGLDPDGDDRKVPEPPDADRRPAAPPKDDHS